MSSIEIEAKMMLRLPIDGPTELSQVEQAFHKMIRRYPLEQFPEKFSEIRQAYQTLMDPTAGIRSLLFDEVLNLSSIIEPFAPLNAPPQNSTEAFLFQSLGALLREKFEEILEELEYGPFDEVEDIARFEDFLSILEKGGNDIGRLLEKLVDPSSGKPKRKNHSKGLGRE